MSPIHQFRNYLIRKPWPLASHPFRRNFAHFVAKSDLGDLNQLREHFGHWSIEMTMLYADGALDEKFDNMSIVLYNIRQMSRR